MEQTNFTCRVDANLKKAFLSAAKTNDRPASVLIRDFMRDYVQNSIHGQQSRLPFEQSTPNTGAEMLNEYDRENVSKAVETALEQRLKSLEDISK